MSALQAPINPGSDARPTVLRAVPKQPRQLAQLPFIFFIVALLGGGLTGVLVLSTTIQTQSSEVAALQTQEAQLRYQEAALVAQAQDLRSSQNLAEQAWALGMRPNPHPAFIKMPDGEIFGVPTEVQGSELPGMVPAAPVVAEPSEPATPETETATPEAEPKPEESSEPETDIQSETAALPEDNAAALEQPAADQTIAQTGDETQ
ncbi:MAG: hypothetical protein GX875_07635 [Propionibacterium sp.]|nr:hypothetical protein [Propionibacterium sp.]